MFLGKNFFYIFKEKRVPKDETYEKGCGCVCKRIGTFTVRL